MMNFVFKMMKLNGNTSDAVKKQAKIKAGEKRCRLETLKVRLCCFVSSSFAFGCLWFVFVFGSCLARWTRGSCVGTRSGTGIKNDEFCIKNDEFCIKNDGLCKGCC